MQTPDKENSSKLTKDQSKSHIRPKKFIFDFAEDQENEDVGKSSHRKSKLENFIPLVHEFTEPQDHQEAYENLCEYIIKAFIELRRLILTELLDDVKDVVKTVQVEQPIDCIRFIKNIAVKCYDKIRNSGKSNSVQKVIEEYEKLLQKSELKIRDLIRNEQIYRISFDQHTLRYEEAEKTIKEQKAKLDDAKTLIDLLNKEKTKLTLTIQSKDEEIRALTLERQQNSNTNIQGNPALHNSHFEAPTASQQNKAKLENINLQSLKIIINNHKLVPGEASRLILTPNIESSRTATGLKKSARATSPTLGKSKSHDRSGKSLSSGVPDLINLNLNGFEKFKDMRESLKQRIEVLTDRRKADSSNDQKLNSSDRVFDGYNYGISLKKSSKRGDSQMFNTADTFQSKGSPKKGTQALNEKRNKQKTISSFRLKPYEETVALVARTDASDDHEAFSMSVEKLLENRKTGSPDYKALAKEGMYSSTATFKRKSGSTKVRTGGGSVAVDSQEKSSEFNPVLLKSSHIGYSVVGTKPNKGKSLREDDKEQKNGQNNTEDFSSKGVDE